MSDPYVGQILMLGSNFAPRGYALCNGQLLSIPQNQALFSLIGTTYGGNGTTTFALPNLQSRLPVHWGQGPGLSNYNLGQASGSSEVTITVATMPHHTHLLNATQQMANATSIGNTVLPGKPTAGSAPEFYANDPQGQSTLTPFPFAGPVVGMTGGNQPHNNMMPSLCITFVIALQGIFPSRN